MIEYYNQLRIGILEAYSGIFQGFKNKRPDLMTRYAAHVLQFIESIYADVYRYAIFFTSKGSHDLAVWLYFI